MSLEKARSVALTTLRFVFCGVGGFILFVYGVIIVIPPYDSRDPLLTLALGALLAFLFLVGGPLLMLYGVGEWGRWHYLWVFLALPVTIFAAGYAGAEENSVFIALPVALIVAAFVRRHYRTKPQIAPATTTSMPS